MAYSNKVLDHYNNPRNVGSFDKSDPNVGTGMVGAPECPRGYLCGTMYPVYGSTNVPSAPVVACSQSDQESVDEWRISKSSGWPGTGRPVTVFSEPEHSVLNIPRKQEATSFVS